MNRFDSFSLSALAAEAFATTTSEERRNTLLRELLPPLYVLARKISRSEHHAVDLVQEVCVECLKGKFDPSKGSIQAWAYSIISNRWKDENQPRRRAVGGDNPHPERVDVRDQLTNTEQRLDRTSTFCLDDLVIISRWQPRDRVILLCREFLWQKVSKPLWMETLAVLGLPADFPGLDFADLSERERNAKLASALGIPVNTLCKRWERRRNRVRGLRCVRELAGL